MTPQDDWFNDPELTMDREADEPPDTMFVVAVGANPPTHAEQLAAAAERMAADLLARTKETP